MMAAAQPFLSGAISKTINLPSEASVPGRESSTFRSSFPQNGQCIFRSLTTTYRGYKIMSLQPIDYHIYFYHDLSHFMRILFHRLFVQVQTPYLRRFN